MKFYDCSTAPSPRRARMVIVEKGLDIETQDISIAKGEQMGDAFRAINPRATVPVLVTDEGTVLTENIAIAAYLDAAYPETPLMGRGAEEIGMVAMWNAIAEQQGLMAVAEALRNGNPAMKGRALTGTVNFDQIPELAARGVQRAGLFLNTLEARLSESKFLAGDAFSFADITAFVVVDFMRVIKMRPSPEDHPATLAWFEAIKTRPSAQA